MILECLCGECALVTSLTLAIFTDILSSDKLLRALPDVYFDSL